MAKEEKLLPAYLIVGEDGLKRETAVRRLKARLGDDSVADFNLDERAAGPDLAPDELATSLDTMPFGSDFRLVIVTEADKLSKAVSETIVSYLADPNPDTVLCVVAEKLAKSTRLYKALSKQGAKAVIDCSPKKRWELPAYVRSMAVSHGVTISQSAAEELVSRVGESTVYLDNEIATLSALVGERGEITLADVKGNVARTAEVKPWDFLDAVCARDSKRAMELLEMMPTTAPIVLQSLLTSRIRELICAKSLESRGEGSLLATTLGKQAWQVKNHLGWSRRYTMIELERALAGSAECERRLKGTGDDDTALRLWVLSMTRKARA